MLPRIFRTIVPAPAKRLNNHIHYSSCNLTSPASSHKRFNPSYLLPQKVTPIYFHQPVATWSHPLSLFTSIWPSLFDPTDNLPSPSCFQKKLDELYLLSQNVSTHFCRKFDQSYIYILRMLLPIGIVTEFSLYLAPGNNLLSALRWNTSKTFWLHL